MKAIALSIIIALSVGSRIAQGGDLVVGHVHLRLGMSQQEALASLSRDFNPKQVNIAEGKFLLWARDPVARSAGSVSFRDGKLYRASKTWSDDLAGGNSAAEGLIAVLAKLAGRDGRTCRVRAETLRAPGTASISGSEVKLLTIELPPDRRVVLQVTDTIPAPGAIPFERTMSVKEFLVDLPQSK